MKHLYHHKVLHGSLYNEQIINWYITLIRQHRIELDVILKLALLDAGERLLIDANAFRNYIQLIDMYPVATVVTNTASCLVIVDALQGFYFRTEIVLM